MSVEFAKLRVSVRRGFEKIAVLVQTKVGLLRAGRLGAQDGAPEVIFDSEDAALEYLKDP